MYGIVVKETRKRPTLSSVIFLTKEKKYLNCKLCMTSHVVILMKRYEIIILFLCP